MTPDGVAEEATVLRVRGLELVYGARRVLSGVDLEVRSGQVWFLLGPNGSGKTTLLNAILGLLGPRAGTLRLRPSLAARDRIGYTPQKRDLNPTLPTTVPVTIRASRPTDQLSYPTAETGRQADVNAISGWFKAK